MCQAPCLGDTVLALHLLVVLGATLPLGQMISRRLHVVPPVVLLAMGAVLGFVTALREAHLPPEVGAAAVPARPAVLGEPDHAAVAVT